MSGVDPAPLEALLGELLAPGALRDWLYTLRRGHLLAAQLEDAPTPASVAALLAESGQLDGAAFAALGIVRPDRLPAIRAALRKSGASPRPAPRQPIHGLRPARAVYDVSVKDLYDSRGRRRVVSRKAKLIIDRGVRGAMSVPIPYGSILLVEPGATIPLGGRVAEWDPNVLEVLADTNGEIRYEDLHPGQTLHRWPSAAVVRSCADEALRPRMSLNVSGKSRRRWFLPVGAVLAAADGATVTSGQVLARIYRTLSL